MRRALNLTLIHLIRFPLNHSHLVLTRQFHSEGKPMTPPETCKIEWSEPVALNSAENFSLYYRIFCIHVFIIWSHVLRQPRFSSSGKSPMWRHPSRLSARIRQEHVPKNGTPKWQRWFSCHNTRKDNGHHFSLLTISKTVHKCSEGIYLILILSTSNYENFFLPIWNF